MKRAVPFGVALALILMLVLLVRQDYQAYAGAEIVVTETADEDNSDGDCSLREAVRAATEDNSVDGCTPSAAGTDVIQLQAEETYALTLGELVLSAGGDPIDIVSSQAGLQSTINGASSPANDRLFAVAAGMTATLKDLVMENARGIPGASGGAITNSGDLTLENVTMRQNIASVSGGAILNNKGAKLTVRASTFSQNHALGSGESQGGGAIFTDHGLADGTMSLEDVTFDSNTSGSFGGAITGSFSAIRVTFSRNEATTGGAFSTVGGAGLVNVTISGNTAALGGAIETSGMGGITQLVNVTVAANITTGPTAGAVAGGVGLIMANVLLDNPGLNCQSPAGITGFGGNLDTGTSCGFVPADSNLNAGLEPLADNGGLTMTHALQTDSDALNHCLPGGCWTEDQRGEPRPQGRGCDTGAFESAVDAPPTATGCGTFGATATPTATTSPTPTGSVTPTGSAGATPVPTGTQTPTPSATGPTSSPSADRIQGDIDCDGDVDLGDFRLLLAFAAGLITGEQPPGCFDVGEELPQFSTLWGDVNCDGAVDARDGLWLIAALADFELPVPESCVAIAAVLG